MALTSPRKAILVTGACGEIGSNLLSELSAKNPENYALVGVDISTPAPKHHVDGVVYIKADICDPIPFQEIEARFDCEMIFHLAAVLSTGGEREPDWAFRVNEIGSMNVLNFARRMGERRERPTKVIFPSSIAVYGLPEVARVEERDACRDMIGAVREDQFADAITMYGINKRGVENLGRYFSKHYRLLRKEDIAPAVDFRALRFPGILSANTLPTGGTTDYAPEMVHAAAQGKMYECFTRPKTRIPFLALPDAVRAIFELARAPREKLTLTSYNISGFSVSAEELAQEVKRHFLHSAIVFKPDVRRMRILESWPVQMDDSAAQNDWHWKAELGFQETFENYLVPGVSLHYGRTEGTNVVTPVRAVL